MKQHMTEESRAARAKERRYFDGFVRTVVETRYVNRGTGSTQVRVELLSCGHDQVFDSGGNPSTGQGRLCAVCIEMNARSA